MPGLKDPNWWPTPPQRRAETMESLFLNGWVGLAVVAVLVVVLALALGHRATTPAATHKTAPVPVPAAQSLQDHEAELRQAFHDCMREAGATGGFGMFGRPSPEKMRESMSLCRGILRAPTPAPRLSAPVV